MAGMANLPQTVSTTKAEPVGLAAADRGGRQPARRARRRPLARGRRASSRRSTSSRATRSQAGQLLLRLRDDDEVAKLQSLEARPSSRRSPTTATVKQLAGAGHQPGGRRQRRGQPAQRQGAGRAAAGDRRQEDAARALRRPARHPPGRSRPVSRRRHGDRHAAGARSDLSSTSSCRSRRSAQIAVGQKVEAQGRCLSRTQIFTGKITAINPKVDTATRNVQVRATLPNPERKLLPGMFATVEHRRPARRSAADAAADGDHLQSLRRHWSSSSTTRARAPTASRSSSRGRSSSRPARRAATRSRS